MPNYEVVRKKMLDEIEIEIIEKTQTIKRFKGKIEKVKGKLDALKLDKKELEDIVS